MLSITVIGVGKLAQALTPFIHSQGIIIDQVIGRELSKAKRLAEIVQASALDNLSKISDHADFYFLCVNDDAIQDVAYELRKHIPSYKNVIHFSGMHNAEIIGSYFLNKGVLWPLQSINEGLKIKWEEVPFFLESNDSMKKDLINLCKLLNLRFYEVGSEEKKWIHLAAVFANNFSNYNMIIASDILKSLQIPFEVMQPILKNTIGQAFKIGPEHTQTGPAARNDMEVIKKQLMMLNSKFKEYKEIYELMSNKIMDHFDHNKN